MSTEIQFYHLTSTPLERVLPKLLEKALAGGFRALVLAENEARVEALNALLWTYHPDTFLPHGSAKDGFAQYQPIWLTHKPENPNRADLLLVTDGSALDDFSTFRRVLDVFDGSNEESLGKARLRWQSYKSAGHTVTYIRQKTEGGWEQQAAA